MINHSEHLDKLKGYTLEELRAEICNREDTLIEGALVDFKLALERLKGLGVKIVDLNEPFIYFDNFVDYDKNKKTLSMAFKEE